MKLCWRKRRINFCLRYQMLFLCCRDSNLFCREFMLSCTKISLLIILRCIFSKAPLLTFDGISFGSLKIWFPRTDFELRKESDWLTSWPCSGIELLTPETVEFFSLPKVVLPLLSALFQSCCNKNWQTFLANSIVPDLFRWTLLSFKSLSVSMVSVWSIKVISRSPHIFISRTSCALLFRLSFRETISNIVTAFFLILGTVQGQWLTLISD